MIIIAMRWQSVEKFKHEMGRIVPIYYKKYCAVEDVKINTSNVEFFP
jgi:hypothetical protein